VQFGIGYGDLSDILNQAAQQFAAAVMAQLAQTCTQRMLAFQPAESGENLFAGRSAVDLKAVSQDAGSEGQFDGPDKCIRSRN
jgi:hypothetical protein